MNCQEGNDGDNGMLGVRGSSMGFRGPCKTNCVKDGFSL